MTAPKKTPAKKAPAKAPAKKPAVKRVKPAPVVPGKVEAVEGKTGKWFWKWTFRGTSRLSPAMFDTKAAALSAGRKKALGDTE